MVIELQLDELGQSSRNVSLPINCIVFYLNSYKALDDKAQHLRTMSDKYKKDSIKLNMQSTYARIGAIVVFIIIILLVLKIYLF